MVTIAIAGGRSQVAREVLAKLLDAEKHKIVLLTRNALDEHFPAEVTQHVVDYRKVNDLVEALHGVHTVLSFIQVLLDVDQVSQKNLINAAILAGVKRFAPSEYGSAATTNMPWWEGKQKVREYLKEVNTNGKALEYCLFQPGLFLDYLAFPHKTAKHLSPLGTVFDILNHRAIVVEGSHAAIITLTTVDDFATIVARSVEYQGEWPEVGGIQGNKVTVDRIIAIAERIRDRPFAVEKVEMADLERGNLTAHWGLEVPHPAVSADKATQMLYQVTIGMLLSIAKGAWAGSNELNQLFPDYEFASIDAFLTQVWRNNK